MNPKTKLTAEEFEALGDQTVSLRDLYAQQGDAYVLSAEAVGDFKLANVGGLQNTIKTVRGEADALKLKLKPFETLLAEREVDFDGLSELLTKADSAGDINADAEKRVQGLVETAKKAMQKELDKAKAEAQSAKARLVSHHHETALMKAIAEEGGDPEVLEPYLRQQTRAFETGEEIGVFAFEQRGTEFYPRKTDDQNEQITPKMLLQQLKAKPNWKHAFKAETIDAPEGGEGHSGGGRGDGFNFDAALKNPGAAYSGV